MGKQVVETPRFEPEFNESLSRWSMKVAISQVWRTRPDYDVDDLMAEARFVFWKIRCHYDKIDNECHFACVYRRSFINRIHRIAEARTKQRSVNASTLSQEYNVLNTIPAIDDGISEAELSLLIDQAPPEIRRVIDALMSTDGDEVEARMEVLENRAACVIGNKIVLPSSSETLNQRLCRISNFNPDKVDMVRRIGRWLGVPVLT